MHEVHSKCTRKKFQRKQTGWWGAASSTHCLDIVKSELPLNWQLLDNAVQALVSLKGLSDHGRVANSLHMCPYLLS